MYINIIRSYRDVVAIADKELIGKKFFEENKQLDIKESFYVGENGKIFSKEEAKKIVFDMSKEDATFNVVGEKSTNFLIEVGMINENQILKIDGIPYTMILL